MPSITDTLYINEEVVREANKILDSFWDGEHLVTWEYLSRAMNIAAIDSEYPKDIGVPSGSACIYVSDDNDPVIFKDFNSFTGTNAISGIHRELEIISLLCAINQLKERKLVDLCHGKYLGAWKDSPTKRMLYSTAICIIAPIESILHQKKHNKYLSRYAKTIGGTTASVLDAHVNRIYKYYSVFA